MLTTRSKVQKLISIIIISAAAATLMLLSFSSAKEAAAQTDPSVYYTFNQAGTLYEAASAAQSTSPYFWLKSGGQLAINNGTGSTLVGDKSTFLLALEQVQNSSTAVYMDRLAENIPLSSDRHAYNGESIIARYIDANNYYYAGLRSDGYVVIKKKTNGIFQTLAQKQFYAGTYDAAKNPNLIPHDVWIGLKLSVINDASGVPQLTLYTDAGKTGVWKQALSVLDSSSQFGPGILGAGESGIQSDHADMRFDNFELTASAPTPVAAPAVAATYDGTILNAKPALYLTMASPSSGKESDQSSHGLSGTYKGGMPTTATLPNGDKAADFNGSSEYLTVPSNSSLSISTAKKLTWEAWIRPDTLSYPTANSDGYVDWMGKCQDYSPSCEWEARIYGASTAQSRPDRLSAYVFNPSAGLGSAADWQPSSGTVKAGEWLHVVAEYDTTATPAGCSGAYPGSINIWVNGVKQNLTDHMPTGCMSQYSVSPKSGNSPLNIGTMTFDTWFKGAIGKVAVYDRLLSQDEISAHFKSMTGENPGGSCGLSCSLTTAITSIL